MKQSATLFLTGATGYVGGHLLAALEGRGVPVRCLARRPEALGRVGPSTEVVPGDVLDRASLRDALRGMHTAYYLVHSMGSGDDFARRDRLAAGNFGAEAKAAGVRRIVYLGALAPRGARLSEHLRSRLETGDVLRASGVPVVEFRASIVIGAGSLSFEMIRSLVERLPVMVCPRWVSVPTQPIAAEDLIAYLVAGLDVALGEGRTYEIGGPERVSYGGLMHEYARQRGLRRLQIPVPFLTPRLSGLWLRLVTPLYAPVGRKLIDGVRNATVVRDDSALRDFPLRPRSVSGAIAEAIAGGDLAKPTIGPSRGRRTRVFRHVSRASTAAAPTEVFAAIQRLGGAAGYLSHNALWRLRGALDSLFGGVGLRRGRRHPEELVPGDFLDFWRVEAIDPPRLLRLRAEMRLPGDAWLEFQVRGGENGKTELRQTATFVARGLGGAAYWWAVAPFHNLVFRGLLLGIQHRADAAARAVSPAA